MDIFKIADLNILSPAAYDAFRFISLCRRRLLRKPHDPDFRFFERQNSMQGDTFVDVGANGGQAAVSFSIFNKSAKILSFEPNPSQEVMLKKVKTLLGSRFNYRMTGLSNEDASLPLFIPFIGELPISTRASLNRDIIGEYISGQPIKYQNKMSIREVIIQLTPFDSLNISASFIKIDVEGAEALVLEGMKETLKKQQPVVMMESSESLPAASVILRNVGYELFEFNKEDTLIPLEASKNSLNNVFALPRPTR